MVPEKAKMRLVHESINGERRFRNLPLPMKWGMMNEDLAASTYVKNLMASHDNVQILHPGLAVHPKISFLRASPDLITFCSCHGLRAVEIKCPWAARNITPEEAIDRKLIDYVKKEGGRFVLHRRKRGHFDQIQGIMACTTITQLPAHLAIWTKAGLMVVDVPFNQEYWNDAEKKLEVFFRDMIIPAILCPSCISSSMYEIQNGVSKMDLSEVQIDSSDTCVNMNEVQEDEYEVEQEDDFYFFEDTYEEGNIQKQESYDEEYEQNLEVIIQEMDTAKKTDQINEDQEVQMKTDLKDKEELENWVLGCKKMCIDGKQSCYSRIKGVMVACDANIACESNSWFHLSCEGYRRIPAQLADNKAKVQYVCTKCRIQHEKKEELEVNKGFMYVENNTDDDDDDGCH